MDLPEDNTDYMHRMEAALKEKRRAARELLERYDRQWDYSGIGIPGTMKHNNQTNKHSPRNLHIDKGEVRQGRPVLVRPPRLARSPTRWGKCHNTITDNKLPETNQYSGSKTDCLTRPGGSQSERKRPGRPKSREQGTKETELEPILTQPIPSKGGNPPDLVLCKPLTSPTGTVINDVTDNYPSLIAKSDTHNTTNDTQPKHEKLKRDYSLALKTTQKMLEGKSNNIQRTGTKQINW